MPVSRRGGPRGLPKSTQSPTVTILSVLSHSDAPYASHVQGSPAKYGQAAAGYWLDVPGLPPLRQPWIQLFVRAEEVLGLEE